jgi:AcrR family transcriptional regulator
MPDMKSAGGRARPRGGRSAASEAGPAPSGRRQQYHSPLREAQANATRERILDAVAALFEEGVEPTFGAVARAADVQERTVYRHFPTKDDLHRAFWDKVHVERVHANFDAHDLGSLGETIASSFAGFAANDGLVRAMLHSPGGRAVRLSTNDDRRRMFERVADAELTGLPAAQRRRAAAAAQVLYSAMSWEYLTDYWDMGPDEAVATVQTAIAAMFAGLRPDDAGPRPDGSRSRRAGRPPIR